MSRHRILKGSTYRTNGGSKIEQWCSQNRENLQMALKYEVTSLDEIDETLHNLYQPIADGSKYVLDVEGVKPLTEFNKVYSSLEKERNDHKQVKQRLSAFGELEPETIQQQLARISELEELAKGSAIDDAKLDTMVNARLNAKIQPLESEKNLLAQRAQELEKQVSKYTELERQRRMADEFSAKIKAAKIDPRFEETIMLKAERLFAETEDGKFLTKDNLPNVTGYMPFEVWLTEQQVSNPHYWGDNIGGGARGSSTQSYRGKNPFEGGFRGDVTEQMRLEREQPALAAQLKKAAGL
jgi:hypothetical protein